MGQQCFETGQDWVFQNGAAPFQNGHPIMEFQNVAVLFQNGADSKMGQIPKWGTICMQFHACVLNPDEV